MGRDGRATPAESAYKTGDITATLGVSRASLVYYEQTGLVTPRRDPETGVRGYSDEDVFDLMGFAALNNLGLSAKQVAAATKGPDLFDEASLEGYLSLVQQKITYYEAMRGAIDRMRSIRVRDRLGPKTRIDRVERHVFVEDGAENGYIGFKSNGDLDALIDCLPVSGLGILFDIGDAETSWRWGRTIPSKLAAIAGIDRHFPVQVGGCDCVTMIARTVDPHEPLPPDAFQPLYDHASREARTVSGDPFVPYIFPPHPGTPYLVCLPLD